MLYLEGMWKFGDLELDKWLNSKRDLIGHYHRSLEDSHAKSNVVYRGPAQEVSEGNNTSNGTRNHCDVLAKNVAGFCPCLKNLFDAKLKSLGLISLAEEISRSSDNHSVLGY